MRKSDAGRESNNADASGELKQVLPSVEGDICFDQSNAPSVADQLELYTRCVAQG